MGWKTGSIGGIAAIWHEGSVFTYHAHMAILPEGAWGIVMLKNVYSGLDEVRLNRIFEGVIRMLSGRDPPPAAPNWALRIAYLVLFALVLLQFLGMVRTVALVGRWRRLTATRPTRTFLLARTGGSALLNAVWGLAVIGGIPALFGMPLFATVRRVPDFGYVLLGSAILALVWSGARTLLVWFAIRQPRDKSPSRTSNK